MFKSIYTARLHNATRKCPVGFRADVRLRRHSDGRARRLGINRDNKRHQDGLYNRTGNHDSLRGDFKATLNQCNSYIYGNGSVEKPDSGFSRVPPLSAKADIRIILAQCRKIGKGGSSAIVVSAEIRLCVRTAVGTLPPPEGWDMP